MFRERPDPFIEDVHGEHISRGASRSMAWLITSQAAKPMRTGQLCAAVNSRGLLGAHFLPGVSRGRQAGDDEEALGIEWTDCVSFPARATKPNNGGFQLVPAIVLRVFVDHPAAPKTLKGRKEKSPRC